LTRYVWDRSLGHFVDPQTNSIMDIPERDGPSMPMIRSDIQPYKSPIDGRLITSASERRDDLARNNCVPYEPMGNAPKGLTNPKFAAKHNAMHLLTEDARDKHKIRIRK
jgi:hypothetical protein